MIRHLPFKELIDKSIDFLLHQTMKLFILTLLGCKIFSVKCDEINHASTLLMFERVALNFTLHLNTEIINMLQRTEGNKIVFFF